MANNEAPLQPGDLIQYKKVGTARIVKLAQGELDRRGGGWFTLEWVKAPKKVREDGMPRYVGPQDRI